MGEKDKMDSEFSRLNQELNKELIVYEELNSRLLSAVNRLGDVQVEPAIEMKGNTSPRVSEPPSLEVLGNICKTLASRNERLKFMIGNLDRMV
jgi:hypothetical protein